MNNFRINRDCISTFYSAKLHFLFLLFLDDDKLLKERDLEWLKTNLPAEDIEDIVEPPRKKVARQRKVRI